MPRRAWSSPSCGFSVARSDRDVPALLRGRSGENELLLSELCAVHGGSRILRGSLRRTSGVPHGRGSGGVGCPRRSHMAIGRAVRERRRAAKGSLHRGTGFPMTVREARRFPPETGERKWRTTSLWTWKSSRSSAPASRDVVAPRALGRIAPALSLRTRTRLSLSNGSGPLFAGPFIRRR